MRVHIETTYIKGCGHCPERSYLNTTYMHCRIKEKMCDDFDTIPAWCPLPTKEEEENA